MKPTKRSVTLVLIGLALAAVLGVTWFGHLWLIVIAACLLFSAADIRLVFLEEPLRRTLAVLPEHMKPSANYGTKLNEEQEALLNRANQGLSTGNISDASQIYRRLLKSGCSQGYEGIGYISYGYALIPFLRGLFAYRSYKNYKKAALLGSYTGMAVTGQMHTLDFGCKRNTEEAKKWLRKAAAADYRPAIEWLKDWFGEELDSEVSQDRKTEPKRVLKTLQADGKLLNNTDELLEKLLEKKTLMDHVQEMKQERERKEASLPKKAPLTKLPEDVPLRSSDIYSMSQEQEELLEQANAWNAAGNTDAAMKAYQKLAEAGIAQGYLGMGNIYYQRTLMGALFERGNAPLAFENFLKAAELGSFAAMTAVGEMLLQGKGCQRNHDEAQKWLTSAAYDGYMPAIRVLKAQLGQNLTWFILDSEYDRMLNQFCQLVEQGEKSSVDVFQKLSLGTERQLRKLGYQLAVGCQNRSQYYNAFRFNQYGLSAYFNTYRPPLLSKGRSAEPVRYDNKAELFFLIIDRRALGDYPILTFVRDRGGIGGGSIGVRPLGMVSYEGPDYPWLSGRREASLIELMPWTQEEFWKKMEEYADSRRYSINKDLFLDYVKKLDVQPYESMLILKDEKEYSYELGHIAGEQLNILWRYSDYPARVIPERIKDFPRISITIPEGVTRIEDSEFENRICLEQVVLPESVEYIGRYAFGSCKNLMDITLPSKLSALGKGAFTDCIRLGEVVIPEGVDKIPEYAFSGCWSLSSVTIPVGVVYLNEDAFSDCSSLTEIIIPEGVTHICCNVFASCGSLQKVTLPKSLKYIVNQAFSECEALEDITIPEGVIKIGSCAFQMCGKLKEAVLPRSVTEFGKEVFRNCGDLTLAVYPESCAEEYAKANEIPYTCIT